MKASDELIKQRNAAQSLAETAQTDIQRKHNDFNLRLCDALLDVINSDATLNKTQAEFVGDTVSNVGYQFMPGKDMKYDESPYVICPFLVMQLATFINSCKE